ncbi:MAG: riboflavin biosynthesis protein RibF [Tannerellaceae bacterium]|jgi:riboflavin kinase/FMN adenylyltransferase|nr:riboflavin biosynthesis protein RibF [Tannerellaceae bacterium]
MLILKHNNPRNAIAATVGFFDGVHAGHRFLIAQLGDLARRKGLEPAVITFGEHPQRVLGDGYRPMLLNSFDEKMELLASLDIKYCILMPFTAELASLQASDFIGILAKEWQVKALLVGYDNRFGKNRRDGFEEYYAYGQSSGIEVFEAQRLDSEPPAVSSSHIRKLLAEGQVEEARLCLAYPYRLAGRIIHGRKIGRTIGFPTANIEINEPLKLIPACGVYAVNVALDRRSPMRGMLYIGSRPTLGKDNHVAVEVHIFNFEGEAYNGLISVELLRYIRADMRFDSLDELKEQLRLDQQVIQSYFNNGK